METQLIKIKFLRLVNEIEEYNERIENLEFNLFGLNKEELRKFDNLPLVVEIGNLIHSKLKEVGRWDTYGYKHHIHAEIVGECLDILNPVSQKMLKGETKKTFEEIMNSISEDEDFIVEGVDPKKYQKIIKNFPLVGTCYKWIHNTENILRKFIIKVMADNGLPYDRSIFNANLQSQVESRILLESKKNFIPKRGGLDIYYLDFKDLNFYFNKYWVGVFDNYFDSKEWITEKIKELSDIRNLVAHNSYNLNKDIADMVKVYCKHIIKQIDPHI